MKTIAFVFSSMLLMFFPIQSSGQLMCVGSSIDIQNGQSVSRKLNLEAYFDFKSKKEANEKPIHIYSKASIFFALAGFLTIALFWLLFFIEFMYLTALFGTLSMLFAKYAQIDFEKEPDRWSRQKRARIGRKLGFWALLSIPITGFIIFILLRFNGD